MRESETKLRTDDFDAIRRRLEELGAEFQRIVDGERHLIFVCRADRTTLADQVLRLRLEGEGGKLTWKGRPQFDDEVKERPEATAEAADAVATREILSKLGYDVALEFEKRREYWRLDGASIVLDELPYGRCVEIEASPERIESLVAELGLESAECVEELYPDPNAEG